MGIKTGNSDAAITVRAGCGLRYDPDQLGDHTGFDFSGAEQWKNALDDKLAAQIDEKDLVTQTSMDNQKKDK